MQWKFLTYFRNKSKWRWYPSAFPNARIDPYGDDCYVRPTKYIPGPKGIPLFGNTLKFMPLGEYYKVMIPTLMRMLRKYGDIVKIDGPFQKKPQIFLLSEEMCREMYVLEKKLGDIPLMELLHNYRQSREHIYNKYKRQCGLITSEEESWNEFKKLVTNHIKGTDVVKTYAGQMNEITDDFIKKLPALRDVSKTLELPSNFMNEIYKWSIESMCLISLDCQMGCLKPLAADSEPQKLINCVQEAHDLIYRLGNLPFLWKIYNMRNLEKLFNALDTVDKIIEKHVEFAETKYVSWNIAKEDTSLLQKFLSIDKQTAHAMASDTLMYTDAVSNTAAALLYHVANNENKQNKLRAEAMSVLPDKTTPITGAILKKVLYVKGCIKESMRLFPIVDGISRIMQEDVDIGGYIIPKGSTVMACHALLSMEESYFSEPEKYIPERWILGDPYYRSNWTSYACQPFGGGYRVCIGKDIAEMILAMFILKVVRSFKIEWSYGPLQYKSQRVNTITSPLKFKLIDL